MKYLVDTCGWLQWISDGPLADIFREYLLKPSHLIMPSILQYELYKWLCRENYEENAYDIISFTERCHKVELNTDLALSAAELSLQYKLAMADAIIYASARRYNAELITCDAHFDKLPGVKYIKTH